VRDETFDYGLAPGESFEPVDDIEDGFDLSRPHILTALGPIDPDDLGVAVCLVPATGDRQTWSSNPAQTVAALEDGFNAGLRAMVIVEPVDEGQRSDLAWIAGRSPVHLVVAIPSTNGFPIAQSSVETEADPDFFVAVKVDDHGNVPLSARDIARTDRLLLAFDPNPAGWAEAMERAPLSLMEHGMDAPTVRRILIDNPARALTIRR
jgi:hypothetical protein